MGVDYMTSKRLKLICSKLLHVIGMGDIPIQDMNDVKIIYRMNKVLVIRFDSNSNSYFLTMKDRYNDNIESIFETVFGRRLYSKEYIFGDMLNDLNKYGKEDLMVLSKLLS